MSRPGPESVQWIYRGVWAVLVGWLRVPEHPPTLPAAEGQHVDVFQPAIGFLRYMKLIFWLELVISSAVFFFFWFVITIAIWPLGLLLFLPMVLLIAVFNTLFFVAIHVRYDTTWYVISDRSLRIRRGVWVIHETTITYDNIQNLRVSQGPLQRFFGIANLLVETAGGGSKTDPQSASLYSHRGLIEGVDNAQQIRDLVSSRLRQTSTSGLGDEDDEEDEEITLRHGATPAMTPEHVALLRQIRDAAQRLEGAGQQS